MATATKEQKGSVTVVKLSGAIDEATDFNALIGPPSGSLVVYSRGVTRINSVGVKNWIRFFAALQQKGIPFSFEELGAPLVENSNMVQNFTCGGPVFSVAIPYECKACGANLTSAMKTADIKAAGFRIPVAKCPKCGGQAEFDDVAEEYFAFLTRKP